jgi:hypothetical protein
MAAAVEFGGADHFAAAPRQQFKTLPAEFVEERRKSRSNQRIQLSGASGSLRLSGGDAADAGRAVPLIFASLNASNSEARRARSTSTRRRPARSPSVAIGDRYCAADNPGDRRWANLATINVL